jgi:dipeptidyl aminopeptidase/acylaminoacyl peptidase
MMHRSGPLTLLLGLAASLAAAQAEPSSPVRAALRDDVQRMAKVASCFAPSFSPDGSQIAFISNLSGVPQVWVVPVEGGWPREVTALEDPVTGIEWSPDGAWIAVNVAPDGGMNTQIAIVRPDGKDFHRFTPGGTTNNRLDGFSHDGKLVLFGSNQATPQSIDPYSFEISNAHSQRVNAGQGVGGWGDLSRDGRWATVAHLGQRGDNDLALVEVATGHETPLTPHQPPATFTGGLFSPDGSTIYLSSNRDQDRAAFARIRLGRPGDPPGSIEVLAARPDAELESFTVSEDGHTAALVWNNEGRSELTLFNLDSGQPESTPRLPGDIATGMTLSKNGRWLAVVASGARQPSDIWVLDRGSGRFHQVTHSPHAGVELEGLVAPELVHFNGEDGLALSGWLYRPTRPAPEGAAFVLSFHGGPEGQERPSFNSTYQALLARGIGVFAPNVRGSSGFGRRFVNLDNGALRVDAVRDIRAAATFLVQSQHADPKRLGIMGGSYGGYMTMAGLTEFPNLFAAGADLYGIVNFETFFAHTEPWMAAISKVEYGDPVTQKDLLVSLSPIHKLDRVVAPTLVLHGAKDTNVPVVEAEQVVSALRQRGIPVNYVLFPDEGHGFRKTPNRVRAAVETVSWFVDHLLTGPTPAGATR